MKNTLLLIALGILISYNSFAQIKPISKLEIAKGTTYVVDQSNVLVVDTLIMHDKAIIQFANGQQGKLGARIAYIGENCLITAKGADGTNGKAEKPGTQGRVGQPSVKTKGARATDGEDGGSLELDMHFMKIGKLTIDTRGGKGGNGANGANGIRPMGQSNSEVSSATNLTGHPATNGKPGMPGGFGGNGGNVTFKYSTHDFIPNFNQSQNSNNIIILHKGGENGLAGKSGNTYMNHNTTIPGTHGATIEKNSIDGKLQLIDANK